MTTVREDVEKRNPHALLVGMQIGATTVENSMEVSQKNKTEPPYDPAIPLLGIYLKKMKTVTWKAICNPMFIDGWVDKESSV